MAGAVPQLAFEQKSWHSTHLHVGYPTLLRVGDLFRAAYNCSDFPLSHFSSDRRSEQDMGVEYWRSRRSSDIVGKIAYCPSKYSCRQSQGVHASRNASSGWTSDPKAKPSYRDLTLPLTHLALRQIFGGLASISTVIRLLPAKHPFFENLSFLSLIALSFRAQPGSLSTSVDRSPRPKKGNRMELNMVNKVAALARLRIGRDG